MSLCLHNNVHSNLSNLKSKYLKSCALQVMVLGGQKTHVLTVSVLAPQHQFGVVQQLAGLMLLQLFT